MHAAGTDRPHLPAWLPEDDTVAVVPAGVHWDAVAVAQHVGIAALSVLDARTGRQPGPVIWCVDRYPRLYFLVAAGSVLDVDDGAPVRHLQAACFVAVPGPTKVGPPGPYWLAPPDPDQPGALVDAGLLSRALRHVRGSNWYEWQPPVGGLQQLLMNDAQVHGRACVVCGGSEVELAPAGHAYLLLGGGRLGYAVVACKARCVPR
ncbi:hypothetical protein BX265_2331 [Streptomyces sp. TLI_235]|nr:hypothetical protein [Streptomyces sp. TLI_235]PBC77580.1 hypothetical protein BX265_2331 [Streptomyces sp. TLI_235]